MPWLDGCLRRRLPDSPSLVSFETEEVGTGQVGRCVRVRLRYAARDPGRPQDSRRAAGAPPSLIAKFASADPASREAGKSQNCYLFEVGFYRELAPTVAVRAPCCWHAALDDDAVDHVLLLEDLAPAVPGDQLRGCSPREAELAVVELARLHAPRWNDRTLRELQWLEGPNRERAAAVQALYAAVVPGFVERFGDRLEPSVLEVARRLTSPLASLLARQPDHETIIHRDYRLDNLLFGVDSVADEGLADDDAASGVAVVDWQTVGRGGGASDVAYFVGTSLRDHEREGSEEPLARRYHEELLARGVTGYPWDQCWRDVRASSFGGLVMAVIASMMVGETPRGDEMFAAMARRSARMAEALEAEELLEA